MQMAQVPIFDPYSACGTAWNTICDNPLAVDAVTTTNVVNPYFHVVLLPRKAGDLVPTYVTTTTSTGSIITVSWPAPSNYVDYSIFNTSGLDFVTDAKLSRVRLAPGSVISSFQMAQGTVLSKNGTELVNLYGCPGTVTRAGSRVDIAGATVGLFRVYAPGATTVMLNGASVGFEQMGNYVMSTLLTTLAQQNKSYSSQSTASNGQRKLYRDSAGKLHEVFASGTITQGEIFYRNSTNGGTTWGNTIRLSDGTMTSLAPCITMGSGTNVIVSWQQTNGSNYNVLFRRSTNGGTAWGSITTLQSNFSSGNPGPLPSVSANTQSGRVVVVYRSSSGMRYVQSPDNMASWTGPTGVPGSTSGNHNSPSSAYYANDVNNCNLAFATDAGYSSLINYSSYTGTWSPLTNLSSVIPSSYQQQRNPSVVTTTSIAPPLCHVAWEALLIPPMPVLIHRKGTSGNFGSQYHASDNQACSHEMIRR